MGTDFRMYDVKLSIACAQTSSNSGYDYIYQQTTLLKNNNNVNLGFTVAKALALQLDKSGVLSVADAVFSAYTNNDTIATENSHLWPSAYSEHYDYFGDGKRAHTMVRAVRVDTDGYLLNAEGTKLQMTAGVVDRDYQDSELNISMTKALVFSISFNLRSPNALLGWIGRGDNLGELSREVQKTYTK